MSVGRLNQKEYGGLAMQIGRVKQQMSTGFWSEKLLVSGNLED
jgi:hypothetical protein